MRSLSCPSCPPYVSAVTFRFVGDMILLQPIRRLTQEALP